MCVYAMPHPMLVGIPVDVWKVICDEAQGMHNLTSMTCAQAQIAEVLRAGIKVRSMFMC